MQMMVKLTEAPNLPIITKAVKAIKIWRERDGGRGEREGEGREKERERDRETDRTERSWYVVVPLVIVLYGAAAQK